MKNAFSKIICNEHQKKLIASLIREDKLSHAYIITGPAGSGKRTFADLIAAAAECTHRHDESFPLPCGKCPSCEKILSHGAVDVTYIRRPEDRTQIVVGQIRALQSDVYVSSTEQKNKIYIIEDAHIMNEQAQNAFLTTLEEPPKNVIFLLLCENPELLLETIKSRAQIIPMEKIPHADTERYLIENSPKARALKESSPESLREIIVSANGSIGAALDYLDAKASKKLLEKRAAAKELLSLSLDRRKRVELVSLFSTLSKKKRDELCELFSLVTLALRDIAAEKKAQDCPSLFFTSKKETGELAELISLPGIFIMSDALESAISALSANANVQITLAMLLCELQKK